MGLIFREVIFGQCPFDRVFYKPMKESCATVIQNQRINLAG
jgi:hypothetical protein